MSTGRAWARGDTGPLHPLTIRTERTILAVVHGAQSGDRLNDFLDLIERDPRIQVVWSLAPGSCFERSGREFLRDMDAAVLPWEEAVRHRYDLVLAANQGLLEQVRGPALILPHGTGVSRMVVRGSGYGPAVARPVGGAVYGALVRYGRIVPAAVGIAHSDQRSIFTDLDTAFESVVHVVGDPCFDRALSALPRREEFRRAVGVAADEHLVVVSSSWGRTGVWGVNPDIVDRLMRDLPHGHVAAMILHPGIWWVHGPRQVLAWLHDARHRGLRVLAPFADWQGLLVAADVVMGDPGSVTAYAAGLGAPTLLAGGGLVDVAPGSTPELLHRITPNLPVGEHAVAHLEDIVERWSPEWSARVYARLTSVPGRSAGLIRALSYRLMDLAEPVVPAVLSPLSGPTFVGSASMKEGWRAA